MNNLFSMSGQTVLLIHLNKPFPNPICPAVMDPFSFSFSSCLHLLSIQVWQLLPAHADSLSVCTLSASWGWLGETAPPHFYYLNYFHVCWCCFRAADEREPEGHTRCVGSACSSSVFFICLGYDPGLSSVIIFFWYVSHPTFLFHISVSVIIYFYWFSFFQVSQKLVFFFFFFFKLLFLNY